MDGKTCKDCGQTKPLDAFHQGRRVCKECFRLQVRESALQKRGIPLAAAPPYRPHTYPQTRCQRGRKPLAEKRAVERARATVRWQSDPEYQDGKRRRTRAYYARNIDHMRARSSEYRRRHPLVSREQAVRRRARLYGAAIVEKIDRAAIIARDHATCYLCGRSLTKGEITLDHVIPLARGGTHTADNLRVACRSCNCRKHTRLLEEL